MGVSTILLPFIVLLLKVRQRAENSNERRITHTPIVDWNWLSRSGLCPVFQRFYGSS